MRPQTKTILSILLFAAGSVGFVFLALLPIFRGVAQDREELLSVMKELAQMNVERKHIQDFELVSRQYEAEFARIGTLFIDLDNPIDFFKFLEDSAEASRLSLEISPGSPLKAAEDSWPSLNLQLAGAGPYPRVVEFLAKLEHAPYLMELKGVSITESPENTTFQALLKVYLAKVPPSFAAARY